jgi:hypothetical protein
MAQFRFALALLVLAVGCDSRSAQLEKENQELKTRLDKQTAAQDYELQGKCSKDARVWFNENYSRDKDTLLLDFSNHYNAKLNKCFILVEYHYTSNFANVGGSSWTNIMTLYDVYENAKYARFIENHVTNYNPEIKTTDEVITCEVYGNDCKTGDEFNGLIRPYVND